MEGGRDAARPKGGIFNIEEITKHGKRRQFMNGEEYLGLFENNERNTAS
jgi:hypothetical protein